MYVKIVVIFIMNIILSYQNVIRNCSYNNETLIVTINATINGTTNATLGSGADIQCPSFSQLICPTECDPSCKRPLLKRSMCAQPIACPEKACVCSPEYVKDNTHKCIPSHRCSESCPTDQIYKLCPSACDIHCAIIDTSSKVCPEDERDEHDCIAGCVCPSGLIRDYSTGKCVKKEMCSQLGRVSCPPNEEYRNCSKVCDKVCNKDNTVCDPKVDCKKGCFCKNGFIRQNLNAKCIPENNCLTVLKDISKSDINPHKL